MFVEQIYDLALYSAVLASTGGAVPEFVNPKYMPDSRAFVRPVRLECMMQDYSRLVPADARVSFTQFPAWTYMPCKNSIQEARRKADAGLPLQCAAASEMAQYQGTYVDRRLSAA